MVSRTNNDGCVLCSAIKDSAGNEHPDNIYNKKLDESDNFSVLPCIGPLVKGHVMVVSKYHTDNLSKMGIERIKEYEYLKNRVQQSYELYNSNLLEAEHGAKQENNSGACIIHTHVHWIPNWGNKSNLFSNLNLRNKIDKIENIYYEKVPYIFSRGNSSIIRIYSAEDTPSQAIRRIITSEMGKKSWDWAVYPRYDLIKDTVNYWT